MKTQLLVLIILMLGSHKALGQGLNSSHTFNSLEDVITYSEQASLDLIIENIRYTQALNAQRTSRNEILNPTTRLQGSFTHFNELPVTLLPAEVFGGEPGTNLELRVGSPYTTELSQSVEVQLVNPAGWSNYKLAKINADLSKSYGESTRQILHEHIADSYFAIVNLNKQLESTRALLRSADSVYVITQNKFAEGLVSQQDLNNAQVNKLNTEKNLRQIDYLLVDAQLTLKTLSNIPEDDTIIIDHTSPVVPFSVMPDDVALNQLDLRIQLLNQDYAHQAYKRSKAAILPSLSFFTGNTFQLNKNTFQPLSGNWARSNYLGLTLSFKIPNRSSISNIKQAKLDFEIASREMEKVQHAARIEQKKLANSLGEARSEHETAVEIKDLQADSYSKNLNLYTQGLLSVDRLLDSYDAMLNAEYAANTAVISVELAQAKILINNKFN